MTTLEKVIAIVSRESGVSVSELSADTQLDSLPVDSLEFIGLVQCICEEIREIPEAVISKANSIGDLADAVSA